VTAGFSRILETIEDIDDGTKSDINENLKRDLAKDYDSDVVVNALQVLWATTTAS